LACAVVAQIGIAPSANADPVFTGVETVTQTLPTGESVVLTLRWKQHNVGPAGGVPYFEFACDTAFTAPPTSVAQQSLVACFGDGPSGTANGVPAQAPGPRAATGGAVEGDFSTQVCVQGVTYYDAVSVNAPFPRMGYITIPVTCF
jgi:hypothetical protein